MTETPPRADSSFALDDDEKQTLLRLARETLDGYVTNRERPDLDSGGFHLTPRLMTVCGAFVSLHVGRDLRGCIGHIVGRLPLAECVRENTINAAENDYRFSPVRSKELSQIHIEISVLSPMWTVDSYEQIEIGKHGVFLKQGAAQAVFLPQVAPEQGWDLAQTLSHLARKAGLNPLAWQAPETEFEVFTAQVFGEK